MNPEKIVYVDMDGVLANFDAYSVIDLPEGVARNGARSFYTEDNYAPEYKKIINARQNDPAFFTDLPVIDGAIEGFGRIIDAGYHPRILSAPLSSNPMSEAGKKEWLKKHLVPVYGDWVVDEAIIDRQKHMHDGLVLIDDRSEVVRPSESSTWEHIVFDDHHNQFSRAAFRLMGWRDENLRPYLDEIYRRRT